MLIHSWLQRNFVLEQTKLKGQSIIPQEALREAIVNALIHRKYSIIGATKIALFENRLEIFNPGSFPGLVDINNLGDGTTYLRNPTIANIARRHRYMEKLGTGISLILGSCKKAGLKAPEFIEGADSVKIIFHFIPDIKSIIPEENNILNLFKIYDEINASNVIELLNVSRNTATRKLNKLVKSGILQRIGKRGPGTKYIKTQ